MGPLAQESAHGRRYHYWFQPAYEAKNKALDAWKSRRAIVHQELSPEPHSHVEHSRPKRVRPLSSWAPAGYVRDSTLPGTQG
jgi:hypothetical protein